MMKTLSVLSLVLVAAGCASYSWRSSVPADMRTVQVPVFRDASGLTETGPVVTRQILREFQREGTFSILSDGAALEVQGEVVTASSSGVNADYKAGSRMHGGTLVLKTRVSVIDKVRGLVLVDNRVYEGEAPYSSLQDNTTAYRDAAGRAADDLAQKVVDDVLRLKFDVKTEKK